MEFLTLLMGFLWAQCYVHKTLIKHTKVKQRKADNMHAQPGTSQIKCNQLQCWRPAHAHYCGWAQKGGWRILLDILSHDPGWLWKHDFAGSKRFCRLLGPEKRSKSCFFGQRLWLRAFSHHSFTMSVIFQMEFSCIEKNTVSGIRLIGW